MLHKGDGEEKEGTDSGDWAKSAFDHCLSMGTEGQGGSEKIQLHK